MLKIMLMILIMFSANVMASSSLEGVYKCKGNDAYGPNYAGTVTVKKQGDVYRFTMQYNTKEKSTGIGILAHRQFNIAFRDAENDITGLQQYNISKDKSKMQGKWVHLSNDSKRIGKLGFESCVKSK